MGLLQKHSGGRFLSSTDDMWNDATGLENGKVFEITGLDESNVARADEKPQVKAFLELKDSKPLVLNKTNLDYILDRLNEMGKPDDDAAVIGLTVLVWVDPDVKYKGKKIKGLRLADVPGKPADAPSTADEPSDDIPF